MARDPDVLADTLRQLIEPDARGRLLARGLARGMVWRDGVVPEGGPAFSDDLTADLLDFGYGVLAIALELKDANRQRPADRRYVTDDGFRVAAEAIESAVRRGEPARNERGRHLVVAATSLHLGGFAARAYSLLSEPLQSFDLPSPDRALAMLLRRYLRDLRAYVGSWLQGREHNDEGVKARLSDESDPFDAEDAAVVALSRLYFQAVGFADSGLYFGDPELFGRAISQLETVVEHAAAIGNVPTWWTSTLTRHLLDDLWDNSVQQRLPVRTPGEAAPAWPGIRQDFIDLIATRAPPQIDFWPSQLEAAARAPDVSDDLVVALPTSAGKTRIAELCILRALADEKRVIYVTPLRALSAQVEQTLAKTFVPLGFSVTSLYGASGATSIDAQTLVSAQIVVATPEKLDFALRQDPSILDDVGLVVLDEGHMIGAGSREIRYEVLIQRLLRRSDAAERRIVCLSAMFDVEDPFFQDFRDWLKHGDGRAAVNVKWRPTRQRIATLDWQRGVQRARLSFIEGEKPYVPKFIELEPPRSRRKNAFPQNDKEYCIAAAGKFASDGQSVLVYSPQRKQVEPLVDEFCKIQRQGYLAGVIPPSAEELAVAIAIGREWLGDSHPAVRGLTIGVGTHHGALPRPFLGAVESLLEKRRLPIVVASPTLAQGIDLACPVLIFRSLQRYDRHAGEWKTIPAAEFANVLGRAGRAYVDLDGTAVYPIFASGQGHASELQRFQELVQASRSQRLVSGLAILVYRIAIMLQRALKVPQDEFLEYILNHRELWEDERVGPSSESTEDEEQSIDELLADLDLAIFSLVEQTDIEPDQVAALLDSTLTDSLWKRTLARAPKAVEDIDPVLLRSRAEFLWRTTSVEQRKACFSSSLGSSAGVFLYDNLDALVPMLVEFHDAIVKDDAERATTAAIQFATKVVEAPFFAVKRPAGWEQVLKDWISGTAFSEILDGHPAGERQTVQAFVQDGLVFKLVWAAEAVRVQATTRDHPQALLLGDGPALALTYGVPSVQASLLCQLGFAPRVGAVWLHRKVGGEFTDFTQLRAWLYANHEAMSRIEFWESSDHRLLWDQTGDSAQTARPKNWMRLSFPVDVEWSRGPTDAGARLRLIPLDETHAQVCSLALEPVGVASLPVPTEGVHLKATTRRDGKIDVEYFGPK